MVSTHVFVQGKCCNDLLLSLCVLINSFRNKHKQYFGYYQSLHENLTLSIWLKLLGKWIVKHCGQRTYHFKVNKNDKRMVNIFHFQ